MHAIVVQGTNHAYTMSVDQDLRSLQRIVGLCLDDDQVACDRLCRVAEKVVDGLSVGRCQLVAASLVPLRHGVGSTHANEADPSRYILNRVE